MAVGGDRVSCFIVARIAPRRKLVQPVTEPTRLPRRHVTTLYALWNTETLDVVFHAHTDPSSYLVCILSYERITYRRVRAYETRRASVKTTSPTRRRPVASRHAYVDTDVVSTRRHAKPSSQSKRRWRLSDVMRACGARSLSFSCTVRALTVWW